MKLNFSKALSVAAIALFALFVAAAPARAQEEGALRVIDEVVAQVNTEVLTLSMVKKEMKNSVEGLKQQKKLTEQQAQDEVAKRQNEIIATLINEQVLLQKGKELGFAEDVERDVNKRMLEVAKDANIQTIEELERAMRAEGVVPAEVRQTLRSEIMKNYVLGSEVDRKVYFSVTNAEIKSYYEANKDKFRKPEMLTLSEIYLSAVGRDEAEVRALSEKLVAQARAAGADFGALAAVQSEREQNGVRVAPQTKGKVGAFAAAQISNQAVADAIKNLKVGGVSDPIKADDGFMILHVDERVAGGDAAFDENKVREAITFTRLDKEREAYLRKLRQEAYIELAAGYREGVLPLLKLESDTPAAAPATKKEDKKKDSGGNR